jgi:hypothetical protein
MHNSYGQRGIKRTNNFKNYKDTDKEIGATLNLSYLHYADTYSPQLQIHFAKYVYYFLGIGGTYGALYNNNQIYNTITFDTHLKVNNELAFLFKPGVLIKNIRNQHVVYYTFGFECNYQFKYSNNIYFGPSVQFDLIQDDLNFMTGFFVSYKF